LIWRDIEDEGHTGAQIQLPMTWYPCVSTYCSNAMVVATPVVVTENAMDERIERTSQRVEVAKLATSDSVICGVFRKVIP
jgi:hypothetical protein